MSSLGVAFELSSIANILNLGWVKETGSRRVDMALAWLNLEKFVGLHVAGLMRRKVQALLQLIRLGGGDMALAKERCWRPADEEEG